MLSSHTKVIVNERQGFLRLIQVPAYLIISLWVIHILKVIGAIQISRFGLLPRSADGVIGIFASPFIHGSFEHLMSNSVPLFVLTLMLYSFYRKIATQSLLLIYIMTGLAVWLFARGSVIHVGASGVVYGLFAIVF